MPKITLSDGTTYQTDNMNEQELWAAWTRAVEAGRERNQAAVSHLWERLQHAQNGGRPHLQFQPSFNCRTCTWPDCTGC